MRARPASPDTSPGPPPQREVDVLRQALALLRERLPAGWSAAAREDVLVNGRRCAAEVELSAADGSCGRLLVEAKRVITARELPALAAQLREWADQLDSPAEPMVVARFLPASVRTSLHEWGIAYADATGNLRVTLDRPALFLRDTGAQRDPWRGPGRQRDTLRGPPAARVVRALVDYAPPASVPEIVRRAGASTGATYRVVELLDSEGLIERAPRGRVTSVAWRRLLERWGEDYSFQRSNSVASYLQPRGLPAVSDGLRGSGELRYAVTGSLAVERFTTPYAPARLAMVYVDDLEQAADMLDLRPVDNGANVLLAATSYDVVFDRVAEADGLTVAAPSQVAVDVLTGPGRGPAEARALLDWMEADERA